MIYGYVIILLAWFWQAYKVKKSYRSINPWFLRLQAVGVLILVFETFESIYSWLSWINILVLIVILYLLWKIGK